MKRNKREREKKKQMMASSSQHFFFGTRQSLDFFCYVCLTSLPLLILFFGSIRIYKSSSRSSPFGFYEATARVHPSSPHTVAPDTQKHGFFPGRLSTSSPCGPAVATRESSLFGPVFAIATVLRHLDREGVDILARRGEACLAPEGRSGVPRPVGVRSSKGWSLCLFSSSSLFPFMLFFLPSFFSSLRCFPSFGLLFLLFIRPSSLLVCFPPPLPVFFYLLFPSFLLLFLFPSLSPSLLPLSPQITTLQCYTMPCGRDAV